LLEVMLTKFCAQSLRSSDNVIEVMHVSRHMAFTNVGISPYEAYDRQTLDELFFAAWDTLDSIGEYSQMEKLYIVRALMNTFFNVEMYPPYLNADKLQGVISSGLPGDSGFSNPGQGNWADVETVQTGLRIFADELEAEKQRLLQKRTGYAEFRNAITALIEKQGLWTAMMECGVAPDHIDRAKARLITALVPVSAETYSVIYERTGINAFLDRFEDLQARLEAVGLSDEDRARLIDDFCATNTFFKSLQRHVYKLHSAERAVFPFSKQDLAARWSGFTRNMAFDALYPICTHMSFDIVGHDPGFRGVQKMPDTLSSETSMYSRTGYPDIIGRYKDMDGLMAADAWVISALMTYPDEREVILDIVRKELTESDQGVLRVSEFMEKKLTFDDRFTLMESIHLATQLGERGTLLGVLERHFNSDPDRLISWYMNMFRESDALKLLEEYAVERVRTGAGAMDIVPIFEYIYGNRNKTFTPDAMKVRYYLEAVGRKLAREGRQLDIDTFYNTMLLLSGSVGLGIELYRPYKFNQSEGRGDFKSENSRTGRVGNWPNMSDFLLAWNQAVRIENDDWGQSEFIYKMLDLDIDQLRNLLERRKRYFERYYTLIHRGQREGVSEDDFSNFIQYLMLRKRVEKVNPELEKVSSANPDSIKCVVDMKVNFREYHHAEDSFTLNFLKTWTYDKEALRDVPVSDFLNAFNGVLIPSQAFDSILEDYISHNGLYHMYPAFRDFFTAPESFRARVKSMHEFLSERQYCNDRPIPYRRMVDEMLDTESAQSRMFNKYIMVAGREIIFGGGRTISESVSALKGLLPEKSLFRDHFFGVWEAGLLPRKPFGISMFSIRSVKTAFKNAVIRAGALLRRIPHIYSVPILGYYLLNMPTGLFEALKNVDDDLGRIEEMESVLDADIDTKNRLIEFYEAAIPEVLSPQRKARYGATAYLIWASLPGNAETDLTDNRR
ncbi:MAG: hypothetical protein ABH885_07200, partial [Candidatus Omnitrophota bacterium]